VRSPNRSSRATRIAAAIAVVAAVVVVGARWTAAPESPAGAGASRPGAGAPEVPPAAPTPLAANISTVTPAAARSDSIGGPGYPVDLAALRARLPDNRYWQLGAPTSDPAVARQRAARAEHDNAMLGRVLSGEASPDEIRAYYAERRAISRDYLQLAEIVLAEQGAALPERDRGMFEMSANLHRARLQQIDRDESDALARRAPH
jgi:hypothetical protein